MSDKEKLREYRNTRRQFWPYEDSYHVDKMGAHRFMAKIGDELAGLSYAEIIEPGREARMKMNLKAAYKEYGIGTELLELLMDDLIASGFEQGIVRIPDIPEAGIRGREPGSGYGQVRVAEETLKHRSR